MKRFFINIFAIILTVSIVFSQVGIEIHHHICNMCSEHKVTISTDYVKYSNEKENCECDESDTSCTEKNNASQNLPSLKGTACCTDYIETKVLNDIATLKVIQFKEIKLFYHDNSFISSNSSFNLAWLESNINKTKFLPPKGRSPNKATIEYIHSSSNYSDDFTSDDADFNIA